MVAKLAFSGIILFEKWLHLINYEVIDATFNEYQFYNTYVYIPSHYWTKTITKMAAEIVKIVKMVISVK